MPVVVGETKCGLRAGDLPHYEDGIPTHEVQVCCSPSPQVYESQVDFEYVGYTLRLRSQIRGIYNICLCLNNISIYNRC